MNTRLHRTFKYIKQITPAPIANAIRSTATAFLTPIMFSHHSGHFRSSFKMRAVDKTGKALPWYTFPCIDFLLRRDFTAKNIMEFGGGQSSIWWGQKATQVISFEGNKEWYNYIKNKMPSNVDLCYVDDRNSTVCTESIEQLLFDKQAKTFDVIIIDGLWRYELIELSIKFLSEDGVIICDNSEGYQFKDGFKNTGFQRVDFYGYASGVIMRSCTSIFFKQHSFIFENVNPLVTDGFN